MNYLNVVFLLFLLVFLSCNTAINKSITIENGETHYDDYNTINGNILIGENCKVYGSCRAVNGNVKMGKGSYVESLISVNGRISIAENCTVSDEVLSVNGAIDINRGSEITHKVSTVNGSIQLSGVKVNGSIKTVNGNIFLENGSVVEKDVIIDTDKHNRSVKDELDIFLSLESVVKGKIEVKGSNTLVTVHLGPNCKILGDVINAKLAYQ
jgi:acetyltransferase-like isoleucine patch superfamily enzyme